MLVNEQAIRSALSHDSLICIDFRDHQFHARKTTPNLFSDLSFISSVQCLGYLSEYIFAIDMPVNSDQTH